MYKTPLIFAALVPFAAAAGAGDRNTQAKVDQEKLRGAVPVTAVLGEEVRSQDGRDIGEVDEVIISRDGKVEHVLIETSALDVADTGEQRTQEPGATGERGEGSLGEARDVVSDRTTAAGGERIQVSAKDVRFNADDSAITLTGSLEQPSGMQGSQQASGQSGGLEASEIVGMEVDLSDEESFGSVEDVMISNDGEEVVAVVVDNWDGVDKKRRAFPFEGANFNQEEGEITYELSSQDAEQIPEFNLDRYESDEWFGT